MFRKKTLHSKRNQDVYKRQVSDGISKADQLIDRAINGDAPVYHAAAGSQTSSAGNKSGGSVGHKLSLIHIFLQLPLFRGRMHG